METSRQLYNEVYRYLNRNYIVTNLSSRYKNLTEQNFSMHYKDLINISKLDKYFYLLMKEGQPNIPGSPLNIYLNEITQQLQDFPLLLLQLPIYKLPTHTLSKYIPSIYVIMNVIFQRKNEAGNIYKKFKISPLSLSQNDILKLAIYFTYTIPTNNMNLRNSQEKFAEYLLDTPPTSQYSFHVMQFLIKFFGYKKISEDKLDKTEILIGTLGPNELGLSTENYIVLSKSTLSRVLVKNNKLENKYGNTPYGVEILAIMQTLYHELRHQRQSYDCKSNLLTDISFFYTAYSMINSSYGKFDYEENYRCHEIEKDANFKAWEEVEKLIKKYMKKHDLYKTMKNILMYKMNEELEQITGVRKTKSNLRYLANVQLVRYLDEIIRTNPSKVNREYTQFLKFYNPNGTPKRAIDLLKISSLVYPYKDFYFAQVYYRQSQTNTRLDENEIRNLTTQEATTVINNIKLLLDNAQGKLNKISDRVQKGKETKQEVSSNIEAYFKLANNLTSVVARILYLNRHLTYNPSIMMTIDSMNELIDMINSNKIVISTLSNNVKISRIGRG